MSEELFYDRTNNISGVSLINILDFCPAYGSSVSFSAMNMLFDTNDGYFQLTTKGINNLEAQFNLKYDVTEKQASQLAHFYEESKGIDFIQVRTDPAIYQDISGYCNQYTINHVNNQRHEFNVNLQVSESPGIINWSGMNYLNHDFQNWQNGQSYSKNDIVYTGVYDNKMNNFFYCTEDHSSTIDNSPTGANTSWTQDFFWNPDLNTSSSVKFHIHEMDAGFKARSKIQKNTAYFPIDYSFSSISTKQLKAMLHFLENKAGYRRFKHQIPSVYNRPKVYICEKWDHTFKYVDSHDLKVSFKEDPMGVIPKNS